MESLELNLKIPKTGEKELYKVIKGFVWEKNARKNSLYSKNNKIVKSSKDGH